MKSKTAGVKRVIPFVAALCSIMCFSVGFSSWVVTGGSNALAIGQIGVDDIDSGGTAPQNLDVVTITTLNGFEYATGYGFNNDGVFTNNTNLTGTCTFNVENGRNCFTSFRSDKSFKLEIKLSSSLSGGLYSNDFTSDSISLTSSNFTVSSQNPTDSENITATFVITCTNDSANFTFDFSIHLIWGGASLTSFPNLQSASFNVEFTPKENE